MKNHFFIHQPLAQAHGQDLFHETEQQPLVARASPEHSCGGRQLARKEAMLVLLLALVFVSLFLAALVLSFVGSPNLRLMLQERIMLPWLVEITIIISLLMIASLALTIIRQRRTTHDDRQGLMPEGRDLLATITEVQVKQGWKVGERWERSLWDGSLTRQKTWQTSYDVTAHWIDPRTMQVFVFRCKAWADEVTNQPGEGQQVQILVEEDPPRRYRMDLQSFPQPTAWCPVWWFELRGQEPPPERENGAIWQDINPSSKSSVAHRFHRC